MLTAKKITYDLLASVRIALCQEDDGCHANRIYKHGFCCLCVCVANVSAILHGCVSTGRAVQDSNANVESLCLLSS
jgi:hypothetical protein